ncbi:MAG: biopolymer transporter ExbD [Kiritimatiellae bacterium]|nr:biopolymer transporter ExbD [Kiritimatiellia bacterium]
MKLRRTEEPAAEMDMTPMIDCVFQLLIFFMVTASLAKVDKAIDIHLPVAPNAAVPEPDALRGRGIVNIAPLGTPVGGGTVSADRPFLIGGRLVDEPGLVKIVADSASRDPDFRVCLRVDRNAEYRTVKRAIRACAAAGVFDVIFSTYQAKDASEEEDAP